MYFKLLVFKLKKKRNLVEIYKNKLKKYSSKM